MEDDHEDYDVDFISDVEIDNWPSIRGSYLQFLTLFVSFNILEWMLFEQVDNCEQMPIFLTPRNGMFPFWVKNTWNLLLNIQ